MENYKKLVLGLLIYAAAWQSAGATMGTSGSYKLNIADTVSSGAAAGSTSYKLQAGITGDNFDGKATSSSYTLCAGFVEEAFNPCSQTVTPPAPPGGGGDTGGPGYQNPVTQEVIPTQEVVLTQETQELTQEGPVPTPPAETPPAPPGTPPAATPGAETPLHFGEGIKLQPLFVPEVWCENSSCYSTSIPGYLRPAAAILSVIKYQMIWWPWIFAMVFCILMTLPQLFSLGRRESKKPKRK